MVRFFFFFAHLSHAILREIHICKIMVQHTSDRCGRGVCELCSLFAIFLIVEDSLDMPV